MGVEDKCTTLTTSLDDETFVVDVSGTCYELQKDVVTRFPHGLLNQLWELSKKQKNQEKVDLPRGVYSSNVPNRFFVQRSPSLFTVILQCYTTGRLHVPRWMCKDNIGEEIKFWKLNTHFACECCAPSEDEEDEDDDQVGDVPISKEPAVNSKGKKDKAPHVPTKWENSKREWWRFFQNPKSSRGAAAFACISICVVMISTVFYILESIPELKKCTSTDGTINGSFIVVGGMFQDHEDVNDTLVYLEMSKNNSAAFYPLAENVKNNRFLQYFSNCLSWQIFKSIETLCVIWFTVELALRFVVCPSKLKFLRAPLNVIDVLASANIYLEVFLVLILGLNKDDMNIGFIKAIKILRTVTVLRILKFIRYFEDLRLLVKTFKSAKKELGMLCIFVIVTVLIYSCLLYEIEKDIPGTAYYSVPASAWWSIVTLTTVGFGDVVPTSTLGKIVGGCACVTGIIIIALPVSVLVEHFTAAYKKKLKSF